MRRLARAVISLKDAQPEEKDHATAEQTRADAEAARAEAEKSPRCC